MLPPAPIEVTVCTVLFRIIPLRSTLLCLLVSPCLEGLANANEIKLSTQLFPIMFVSVFVYARTSGYTYLN